MQRADYDRGERVAASAENTKKRMKKHRRGEVKQDFAAVRIPRAKEGEAKRESRAFDPLIEKAERKQAKERKERGEREGERELIKNSPVN